MKLSEYRNKLEQNPEYVEAVEKLRARFQLGNAVLRGRINRGWSQADLAEAVGTKQANISRIEAGLANPTLDLIQRLCQVLGLEFDLHECEKVTRFDLAINETIISTVTAVGTLESVDNQPDHLFCPRFRTSSMQEMQNGVLE